jgi:hypothetical protein
MSLKNRKTVSYYLIAAQNGPTLSTLRQYFKIDTFPSVATLKQEMAFVHRFEIVKVIVTDIPQQELEYLNQEAKISQIIGYGCHPKSSKTAGSAKET